MSENRDQTDRHYSPSRQTLDRLELAAQKLGKSLHDLANTSIERYLEKDTAGELRGFEKRRFPRKRLQLPGVLQFSKSKRHLFTSGVVIEDISLCGMRALLPADICEKTLASGEVVESVFALEGGARPLTFKGTVRRCLRKGNDFLLGLEFVNGELTDFQALARFLAIPDSAHS